MRITRVHADQYSPQELEKLDIALDLFGSAVNSVTFKKIIEEHVKFDTPEKFSNKQIYSIIMSGDELNNSDGADNEADLDLTLDLRNSTDAIGYTTDDGRIFTFRNFFEQLLPTKLAGHYSHEYCHTLGFQDPASLLDTSKNVPYEVGRIIEEIAISNHKVIVSTNGLDLGSIRNSTVISNGGTLPGPLSTATVVSRTIIEKRKKIKLPFKKKPR